MARIRVLFLLYNLILSDNVLGCTYGRSPSCVFPCNCADESEVCDEDTGHCTSQCKDGPPEGFPWSGPGCRVGNVAYGKNAISKGTYPSGTIDYDASNAVDGNTNADVPSGSCFHSDAVSGYTGRYWWYVDLGTEHIIYTVTIFNRYGISSNAFQRLRDFHVFVSDSNNNMDALTARTCAYHKGYIAEGGNVTLQCNNTETLGRYVSVVNSNVHFEHFYFALCEVVVIGAQAIDCSLCAENSNCDPLNGCKTCAPGKLMPDCKKDCVPGTYGQGCEVCHCKPSSPVCDIITGICEDGCEDWWLPPTCSQSIGPASLAGSLVGVSSLTSSSVIVSFDSLVLEDDKLAPHYYYVVAITTTISGIKVTHETSPIPHNAPKEVLIEGLEPKTTYHVEVQPFRLDIDNDLTEAGEPTQVIVFTTDDVMDGNESTLGSDSSSVPVVVIVAPLAVAVVLLTVIVVVVVTLLIRQRKRLASQQESKEPQAHSMQSLHHNEDQNTEVDVDTQDGMYAEIEGVAASTENTGHVGPTGPTGRQAGPRGKQTGPSYMNFPRDNSDLKPVTQAEYAVPEAEVDERPRPAIYEELK